MNLRVMAGYVPGMGTVVQGLRAEMKRVGPQGLAAPLLTAAVIAVVGVIARAAGQASPEVVGLATVRISSIVLPLAIGFAAVTVVVREQLVELQLSLPTDYAVTVLRRLFLLLIGSLVIAGCAIAALRAGGAWYHPAPLLIAPIVPVAPGLLLGGVGAIAALLTRSGAAAGVCVLAAWILQTQLFSRFGDDWLANRTAMIVVGLLVAVPGVVLACRIPERLLGGNSQ